jgi:arylsulfatase A-like enzyme
MPYSCRRTVWRCAIAIAATLTCTCSRSSSGPDGPKAIRLVDGFDAKQVEGSTGTPAPPPPRTEWRFDSAPPRAASPPPGPAPSPPPFAATRGWEAGPGVSGLAVRNGLLVGRTTTDFPVIRIERTAGLDNADQLQALEIRMRVSGGNNVSAVTRPASIDIKLEPALAGRVPWPITAPAVAGDQMQTYTITPSAPVSGPRIRYLLIRPTDAPGADFAIESVRLVFRREQLAGISSGVSWQGLRDVFRETLVTRSPETVRFQVTLPSRPVLDLAVGTPQDDPVTFRIGVRQGDKDTPVMAATVTTPHRWERREVDLTPFAGGTVSLSLSATAPTAGTLAFWGAPVVRQRIAADAATSGPPQGVILVQLDTLRKDHMEVYGYERPTAPVLRGLAEEGALFQNAITQTSWTKAETPSILTSLYPTTHGVHQIPDRLPASATTIAEAYRQAGYATLSYSSVVFTGQFTNLHQGFEELHEGESTAGRAGPRGAKTSREYVDRLVDWLGDHRDVPFFVYLHFFDPHVPYEPYRPYDTLWADPKGREQYLKDQEALKKTVTDAFMAQRGMATRDEMVRAGVDPESYLRFSKDWYDGSIRGMDTEIGRLVERLRGLGLGERTVLAFYADHGEEFHEHGRMWHGQSVYGELIRVPLILWGPGHVTKGVKIDEPVELVDVMPTLLDLSAIPAPASVQGQSMRPLLTKDSGWKRRPPIAERQPMGGTDFPNAAESYAIMDGNWKLIHNVVRPPEQPEFELFDFYQDPLDQKNVASEHPDVVERLAKSLDSWHQMAKAAKLKPDSELTKGMSKEQLDQLRSLGYVK